MRPVVPSTPSNEARFPLPEGGQQQVLSGPKQRVTSVLTGVWKTEPGSG